MNFRKYVYDYKFYVRCKQIFHVVLPVLGMKLNKLDNKQPFLL